MGSVKAGQRVSAIEPGDAAETALGIGGFVDGGRGWMLGHIIASRLAIMPCRAAAGIVSGCRRRVSCYNRRMELIDTHCHLDVAAFDADRPQVLERARRHGVSDIVIPAIHRQAWQGLLQLCRRFPSLHPALGLHPVFVTHHQPQDVRALEQLLPDAPAVAVGEIGLDFHLKELDRERQQTLFEGQLAVARDARLPVLLHVRKAHDQVLATLARYRLVGGIAHAFNGSLQQARRYQDLGFKLGFGGMLTFARSRKLRELVRQLPIEAIVLETDAPDMTVVQHRGERNSPEYLIYCLQALAEVRDEDPAWLARQTTTNARAVLGLTA